LFKQWHVFDDAERKSSSMDSVAQKQILKAVIQTFRSEIDSIWDSNDSLNEAVADIRNIRDTFTKMVEDTYCSPLPSYFYTLIRDIDLETQIGRHS
jgi:hypothetical protein